MARQLKNGAAMFSAVALTALPAVGTVTLYDDRDLFMQNADLPVTLETFETEAQQDVVDGTTFGSGLTFAVNGTWSAEVTDTEAFSYNTTPGGENHLRVGFGTGDYLVSFSADQHMTSFGFDITGYQDLNDLGGLEVFLYDGESLVDSIFFTGPGAFLAEFHGLRSDTAFDRIDVSIEAADFVGFDDLAFEFAPVPAPGALALMGIGLLRSRRRR